MSPSVHHEQYEADVHTNAASQYLVEVDVAGQRVPVAIESQSDELALTIEHR